MRTCLPLNSTLNQKGMSLITVLVLIGILGFSALLITSMGKQKRKMSQQMSVSVSASLVKQKLVGLVLAPQSWQATQAHNSQAFASFDPDHPVTLDIYSQDSNDPFYRTTNPEAGFDLKGNPCTSFSMNGNDNCPFRYDITLKSRVFQNGNWIDTLHFALNFRPSSAGFVLNATANQFTFDIVRNLNDQSVEAACISIKGVYNASTNSCTAKITRSVASCGVSQTYRGPGLNSGASNCDNKVVAQKACSGNQVIKGFGNDGDPICGAPL
jgi:type II secretory pathway pseudopilin PulG